VPRLHTRQELAALATGTTVLYSSIEHRDNVYLPVDFESGQRQPSSPDRTVWRRMTAKEMMEFSNDTLDILFATDGEFNSFYLMLQQLSAKERPKERLLVPVKGQGVMVLSNRGELKKATGEFTPNYLNVLYDPDVDTEFMWKTLVDWLGSEEQAHSLLHHLSVGFQPSWTAGKYLLLIGSGSNGKSTLIKMLEKLIGRDNASSVTRQEMAGKKVTVAALNGALMNIVLDGPKEFLKDSHVEKTVIVGERLDLELKYKNIATTVETTALFIEGLQQEPKVSDHSPALQRRLVRYHFPNTYEADRAFERKMVSNKSLSALVKLILEHWVTRDEKKGKLLNTAASKQLQLEHQWAASPLLQFLEYLAGQDRLELESVVKRDAPVDKLVASYRPWLGANGFKAFDDGYIRQAIDENFITTRKTVRINGKPSTRRVIVEPKETARLLIATLLGEEGDDED